MLLSLSPSIFGVITKKLTGLGELIPWSYKSLNESKRIAGIIKKRIIKEIDES